MPIAFQPLDDYSLVRLVDNAEHRRLSERVGPASVELHVDKHRRDGEVFARDFVPLPLDITGKIRADPS